MGDIVTYEFFVVVVSGAGVSSPLGGADTEGGFLIRIVPDVES